MMDNISILNATFYSRSRCYQKSLKYCYAVSKGWFLARNVSNTVTKSFAIVSFSFLLYKTVFISSWFAVMPIMF